MYTYMYILKLLTWQQYKCRVIVLLWCSIRWKLSQRTGVHLGIKNHTKVRPREVVISSIVFDHNDHSDSAVCFIACLPINYQRACIKVRK